MDYHRNIETPWKKYFPSEVKFHMGPKIIDSMLRPFGTKEVKDKYNAILDEFHPDVVHLNNIHSQLSPIVAELAHQRGIKVVWTLHDYKLLCTLKMTITALSSTDVTIKERSFTSIPVKKNYITQYSGTFFDSTSSEGDLNIHFQVDTTWIQYSHRY